MKISDQEELDAPFGALWVVQKVLRTVLPQHQQYIVDALVDKKYLGRIDFEAIAEDIIKDIQTRSRTSSMAHLEYSEETQTSEPMEFYKSGSTASQAFLRRVYGGEGEAQ